MEKIRIFFTNKNKTAGGSLFSRHPKLRSNFLAYKKWIIGGCVGVFVLIIGIVSAAIFMNEHILPNRMMVYFFSPSSGYLVAEERPWPWGGEGDLTNFAMIYLNQGPESRNLRRTWPDVPVSELVVDRSLGGEYGDMLIIRFSEHYSDMSALEESLFRAAFTKTMTGLDFINSVKFQVPNYYGEIIESVESAASIANNPEISPIRLSNVQFTLYFICESLEGLVTETYLAADIDIQQRGLAALEHLIEMQQREGFFAAIPPETRVRGVTPDQDAAAIYVDLSSEFVTNFTGTSAQARMMIDSIVNTVVENATRSRTPRRVVFLINSERQESFHGVGDFMLPFYYNPEAIVGEYEDEE